MNIFFRGLKVSDNSENQLQFDSITHFSYYLYEAKGGYLEMRTHLKLCGKKANSKVTVTKHRLRPVSIRPSNNKFNLT